MEVVLIKSFTDKPWRSPDTYQLIEDSLKQRWPVRSINTKKTETLHRYLTRLQQENPDNFFVFNIAEYLDKNNDAGFLPALLEEWQVPHLGSSARSVCVGLDKAGTKDLLRKHGIPTPRYFVARKHEPDIIQRATNIGYPLIVKPNLEGGHIGISEDSIVYDEEHLERAINRVFNRLNQPALVEEFITGEGMREFSVGIIDSEVKLFTPIEIDFESMDGECEILSYEAAQNDLEKTKLVREKEIRDTIIDLSLRTYAAVGARDYSRVDLRMNDSGCYVIEINVMPGLGPHSFLPEAAKDIHDLEYAQFIQKLAETSMKRQKNGRRRNKQ